MSCRNPVPPFVVIVKAGQLGRRKTIPGEGIPENPAAWLMKAAKRRAIDLCAVVACMAQGPAAGLDALDAMVRLDVDSVLAGCHLLPSVRGDLLTKMGRFTEAREEIQRAIALTQNLREQELLIERLKRMEQAGRID